VPALRHAGRGSVARFFLSVLSVGSVIPTEESDDERKNPFEGVGWLTILELSTARACIGSCGWGADNVNYCKVIFMSYPTLEAKTGCLDSSYACGASQIEVAIIQLDKAVELFFSEKHEDLISAYTLARNAEEILSVCLKERSHNPLWQIFIDSVEPKHKKQFLDFYNAPRNALKHKTKGNEDAPVLFSRESYIKKTVRLSLFSNLVQYPYAIGAARTRSFL